MQQNEYTNLVFSDRSVGGLGVALTPLLIGSHCQELREQPPAAGHRLLAYSLLQEVNHAVSSMRTTVLTPKLFTKHYSCSSRVVIHCVDYAVMQFLVEGNLLYRSRVASTP